MHLGQAINFTLRFKSSWDRQVFPNWSRSKFIVWVLRINWTVRLTIRRLFTSSPKTWCTHLNHRWWSPSPASARIRWTLCDMVCSHRLIPPTWSSCLTIAIACHIQNWKAHSHPKTLHRIRRHSAKTDQTLQYLLEVSNQWRSQQFSRIWYGLFHWWLEDVDWTEKRWLDKCPDWRLWTWASVVTASSPRQ